MQYFAVDVTDDIFEPEIPQGARATIDTAKAPKDGDLVYVRHNFPGCSFERLTQYLDYGGRSAGGRFCKSGDPQEVCHVLPITYTRQDVECGRVEILGTVCGWMRDIA